MSRILMIAPDYASHYFPMSALADSLSRRGHRVIFATGAGLEGRVRRDGFEFERLVLGPGSNAGLMRPEDQSPDERAQIEAFFEASRRGMVPTLLHQARNRLRDLLWEPERVAADVERMLEEHAPDTVVVDQLAFGATAALRGLGRHFIAFHPGHPSAISVGWPYGYPPRLPPRLRVPSDELEELKALCRLQARSGCATDRGRLCSYVASPGNHQLSLIARGGLRASGRDPVHRVLGASSIR